MERRSNQRRCVGDEVYAYYRIGDMRGRGVVRNLSPDGAFVETGAHELRRGRRVEFVFAYPSGSLIKMRHRRAIVARVTSEGAGIALLSRPTQTARRAGSHR